LTVEQRETVVIRSGSYLASYQNNVVNYNVDACRMPSSLGHVEILINVKCTEPDRKKEVEIEMRTLV